MIPGEFIIADRKITGNAGRAIRKITVTNTGDRPVQIGSHYHFFEVNKYLEFDREAAFGRRLNIPAGTGVRFQPGESREVELIELGGRREVYGLNGLTDGKITDREVKNEALARLKKFQL